MFGPVPDRGHDSSGISVPVLIPCTFLWRNGGRSVALCGTFTRLEAKNDHILMFMLIPRSVFFYIIETSKGFSSFGDQNMFNLHSFGCGF